MQEDRFGTKYGEIWHLFLKGEKENVPLKVENIGQTFPNKRIYIKRENHEIFVIEYIISGVEHLEVGDKEFTLQKGDLCILEPKIPHTYWSDKNDPVEKKWINFSSDIFAALYKKMGFNGRVVFKNTDQENFFDVLLAIAEQSTLNSDDICYDVADNLFGLLFHLAKQDIKIESQNISKLAIVVKEALDNNIFTNASLEEILKDIFYSKKQITREFKKCFNDTPYNYLINLKINMAKRLLTKSDLSIKEIAIKLGFENQHYFSNAFKKKVGMSPSQYREKYIN
ncbi:MAG: AraC family transcriptional regulator [Clostridia bacterium]|nr:AraC family transcriptional regulator [Clostridia bacterium]